MLPEICRPHTQPAPWRGLVAVCRGALVAISLIIASDAHAVVLLDTANALANTTAPTGIYADSGWGFMGEYGGNLGTMIAPQYFITAQHIGVQGGSFVSTAEFNGVADVSYTIDASANGGTGYWNIAGTDLRIFKITGTFAGYVPLYTGSSEVGMTMVTFGRGGPRGADVMLGPDLKGWLTTGTDGVARWGANVVDSTQTFSGLGSLLIAGFDNVTGQNEATLSAGDSGGAVFVLDGGQWKLAGVNYGAEGSFDTSSLAPHAGRFDAALFDKGGFYEGQSSGAVWGLNPDLPGDLPSNMYATRISTNIAAITSIVAVPEPGSAGLLALSALVLLGRRKRA